MSKPLNADDQIVEQELTRFWLAPGERLLLGLPPVLGHVAARVGADLRLPHQPIGDVPELDRGKNHWPLPTEHTAAHLDTDWTDDPTLGYLAAARQGTDDAIRFADHFAHSRGEARLVVSDRRVAVVYPTKLFQPKDPPTVFTTHLELPAHRLAGLDAVFVGRSLGVPPVIRLSFADGSVLHLREPLAGRKVRRAHERATGR